MQDAEIISIGSEMILGDYFDTNSNYLAKQLLNIGIHLTRITIIPDDLNQIVSLIREISDRSEIIISTGGLGPTVDDPTREAISEAYNLSLEFQPELWDQILEKFKQYGRTPTENNKKQALIPHSAIPINNPIGTAPAFILNNKNIFIALPGVPEEMKLIFELSIVPYLKQHIINRQFVLTKILHTSGLGESKIDEMINSFELMSNPEIGLVAKPGQTDIRITAKAKTYKDASLIIDNTSDQLYKILQNNIYGEDTKSLESVVEKQLNNNSCVIILYQENIDNSILDKINKINTIFVKNHTKPIEYKNISDGKTINLKVDFSKESNRYILTFIRNINDKEVIENKYYAGPDELNNLWSYNIILDYIRRIKITK